MPKKWHEVYQNNDERVLFVGKDGKSGLVRSSRDWSSLAELVAESGLTPERCREIIAKYPGMIVPHSDRSEVFGYWQRIAPGR
jgi:hypothetical protein